MTLSETRRKYRKFSGRQKLELVMASLRGERSIAELCREHEISETLLRRWRDQVRAITVFSPGLITGIPQGGSA